MQDFRKLDVWRKAHELTLDIYRTTRTFPADERFGLTSQLRRSSSSIPANLAEGCGRRGQREMLRFAGIANGSAHETDYHLLLSRDLGYISADAYVDLAERVREVKRMLSGLQNRIERSLNRDAAT